MMSNPFEDEDDQYLVVVNHECQFSLWPAWREIPAGWKAIGAPDRRQACLDWIETNWTDMRPRGLAEKMDGPIARDL